jgi:hypothetical protein
MYVREKKIRRGEKAYSYWQLVQGTRVDGKVRQSVVRHLGPLPDRWSALIVAKMWGVMCGEADCTKEGAEELLMYVVQRGRKIEKTVLLCSEHAVSSRGRTIRAVALNREWRAG